MPNTALAQNILELIELNRAAFDMSSWFDAPRTWEDDTTIAPLVIELENKAPTCGTTMCLAGWAAVANGWVLKSMVLPSGTLHGAFADKESIEILYPEDGFEFSDSSYTDFTKLGADLLDIPLEQADHLFTTSNIQAEYMLRVLASGEEFDWTTAWRNAQDEANSYEDEWSESEWRDDA